MAARDYGQYCGVTRALELVGERWAMLIVRDLLVGPRRYGELAAGLAAGGSEARPASDYGFMYQRQLTDPDGNILEFGWMDPVAAAQGPEAFANQQA